MMDHFGMIKKQVVALKESFTNVTSVEDNELNFYKIAVDLSETQTLEFNYSLSDLGKYPEVVAKGFDIPENLLSRLKSFPKKNFTVDFIKQLLKCKNIFVSPCLQIHKPLKSSSKKNSSMKTASDVINRIIWDSSVDATDFSIGYLDRFLGILEKNFTAFTWDDLSSLDYNVFAIPKHRIHYFKYKTIIVWDKTKRIDNVFGSTGSGLTINDILKDHTDNIDNPVHTDLQGDILVLTGNEFDVPKHHTSKPSHFLCQRITNEDVIEKILKIQQEMLHKYPRFQEFIISPVSLHCTLCTVCLNSGKDVSMICQILEDNEEELKDLALGLQIEVENISNFFGRVIYASIVPNENLNRLVEYLKYVLQEGGIQLSDLYDFVPHVTVLKLNPDSKKKVPDDLFEQFLKTKFGCQNIDQINLCEISKDRDGDGFYKTVTKINLC